MRQVQVQPKRRRGTERPVPRDVSAVTQARRGYYDDDIRAARLAARRDRRSR